MSNENLEQQARGALREHAASVGADARARYGAVDWATLPRILEDRAVVRFPVDVVFDSAALQKGEFAWAEPVGDHPRDGYRLAVHPMFESREDVLPLLVAYHIPVVNYGDVTTNEEAEAFAAALLGMNQDDYYRQICALADELPGSASNGSGECPL